MKHTPLTLLTVISLALVGCGSTQADSEPQNAEEAQQQYKDMLESGEAQGPPPMPAGEFELQASQGTHITFELPTDPAHESLQSIEEYREALDLEPVTYIVAEVDNRQGDSPVTLADIYVYDPDGTEYIFSSAGPIVSRWDTPTDETYYMSQDIREELSQDVQPAGKDELILIYEGDDLADEFTRVAAWPTGPGDAEEAYLAD